MVDVEKGCFACDECCCCDESCDEFLAEDEESVEQIGGKRVAGRAFRRKMRRKNIQKYRDRHGFMKGVYKVPSANYEYVNGEYVMVGNHVNYPKDSNVKVFFKRVSNKRVRRYKGVLPKGNGYRKVFDYQYTVD